MKKCFCHHVHLVCTDLQPMVDFWVNVIGAEFVEYREFAGAPGAALDMDSATKIYIKTMPCEPQPTPTRYAGTEHLGVIVENLDETLATVKAMPGGKVTKEPFISGKLRCAFVTGPEGVLVEVMENLQ